MTKQRSSIPYDIPIDIEQGKAGLIYITSPLVRGLLISGKTEEEALREVPIVLKALTDARDEWEREQESKP